jgi:hypothetical protein
MTDPESATTTSADTEQASNVKVRARFVSGAAHLCIRSGLQKRSERIIRSTVYGYDHRLYFDEGKIVQCSECDNSRQAADV